MPGVSGVTVVTNARAFYTTRAAAGALGTRHSLRPLFSEGRTIRPNLAQTCGEIAKLCFSSPSPRSYGERVGVRGSLHALCSWREPLTRPASPDDLSPQGRGEVTSNASRLAV